VTQQLLQGAQTWGIPLLDHLILGGGSFTSLRQQTELWETYPQG
jgi:DNA repair protein RadC